MKQYQLDLSCLCLESLFLKARHSAGEGVEVEVMLDETVGECNHVKKQDNEKSCKVQQSFRDPCSGKYWSALGFTEPTLRYSSYSLTFLRGL